MKLSTDQIHLINAFESLTGAHVVDVLIEPSKFVFVVKQGDLGVAVGKSGSTIKSVSKRMKKQIDVVEFSNDLEGFIRNLLFPAKIESIKKSEFGNKIKIDLKIASKDKAIAIGRGGAKINRARALLKKHYNIDVVNVL